MIKCIGESGFCAKEIDGEWKYWCEEKKDWLSEDKIKQKPNVELIVIHGVGPCISFPCGTQVPAGLEVFDELTKLVNDPAVISYYEGIRKGGNQ